MGTHYKPHKIKLPFDRDWLTNNYEFSSVITAIKFTHDTTARILIS